MPIGIFIALASSLFASTKDLISKKIAFSVDGTTSAFASFLYPLPFYFIFIFILWLLGYETFTLGSSFLLLVFLRASTDCLAEFLKMHTLAQADISLLVPFFSLSPLFLIFLSPLITSDPITSNEIFSLVFIVAGSLLLIPKAGKKTQSSRKAVLLATLCSFFMALNVCFDRLAVQEASAPLAAFAMTLLAALLLLPFVVLKKERNKLVVQYWKFFGARGLFEVLFMTSKLLALQYLTAPTVVGILKVSLLVSIVGGKVFFQEENFLKRIFAGLLIFIGILILL